MIGKNGSLLKRIKDVRDGQRNFDAGCPLTDHVCVGKDAKNSLPVREIF